MSGWLFKIEPEELSIDDLAQRGAQGVCWEGVRNYQARNMLRDGVKVEAKPIAATQRGVVRAHALH